MPLWSKQGSRGRRQGGRGACASVGWQRRFRRDGVEETIRDDKEADYQRKGRLAGADIGLSTLVPIVWRGRVGNRQTRKTPRRSDGGICRSYVIGSKVTSLPELGQYRTPVSYVYLCGAGSHPGGGISLAPGRNAARVILEHPNCS